MRGLYDGRPFAAKIRATADASSAFQNVSRMIVYPFRKGAVVAFVAALALPSIRACQIWPPRV